MSIESICTRDVVVVEPSAQVEQVIDLMAAKRVGCVVVVDSQDMMPMPIGIMTDRDVLMRVCAKKLDPSKQKVADVMSKELVTIPAASSTYKGLGIMRLNGVRRAPLVDQQGQLVGIVTLDDLLNFLSDEFNHLAELIRKSTKRSVCRD